MIEALRERYAALSVRDQRALRVGGFTLLPILALLLGWTVHERFAADRIAIAEAQALTERAGATIAARLAAGEGLETGPSRPLPDRLTEVFTRAGLQPYVVSLQAATPEAGQVEVGMRDVPFDALVGVLGGLEARDGVTVVAVQLVRSSSGRVDASLVLRRP